MVKRGVKFNPDGSYEFPKPKPPAAPKPPTDISHVALASRDQQLGIHDSIRTATAHTIKKYQTLAVVIAVVVFLALVVGVYFLVRSLIIKAIKKYDIKDKKSGDDKSDSLQSSVVGMDALEMGLIALSALIAVGCALLFIERKKFVATRKGEQAYHHVATSLATSAAAPAKTSRLPVS